MSCEEVKWAYLTPTRSTEADREHSEEPRVRLTEVREDADEEEPHHDKEGDNEKQCLPVRDGRRPQETPVTAVRTTEPVVPKELGREEPEHELTTEEGLEEPGHLGRGLAIVVRKAVEQEEEEHDAHRGKGPDDADDPPGCGGGGSSRVQLVSPVPQSGNPELLRALNQARTHHPHFSCCAGLLTEVEAEEAEVRGGRHCITPRGRTRHSVMGAHTTQRTPQGRLHQGRRVGDWFPNWYRRGA
jgi:hypothetical protein